MTTQNKAAAVEEEKDPFDDAQESSGGVLYKWDEIGKSVKGLYTGRRDKVKTKLGDMTVYDILTKDGQIAVPGTKGLDDAMRNIPGNGTVVVSITYTEDVKGNFPNPFKKFSVKYKLKDDSTLAALGIVLFDQETSGSDEAEG